MIAVDVKILNDTATPALNDAIKRTGPQTVATRIFPKVKEHWINHLANMPRNRAGYPTTGFWQQAARSVQGVAAGGVAIISANKIGLAQRLYGGEIHARNVKNLTIPICAEAYGTKAADWGLENLVLVITSNGNKFLALWLGYEAARDAYHKQLGKLEAAYDPDATQEQRDKAQKGLWHYAYTTANRAGKVRASLAAAAGNAPKKPKVIICKGPGGGGGTGATLARMERWQPQLKFLFLLKESVVQSGNPLVLPPDLQEFVLKQVLDAVDNKNN